ncbi:hypothetical protein MTO96_003966 [Rhipicephalus appendiculatus]
MEHAGTGRCERSSTVPHDTAAEGFVAANLKDARQQHGAPGRRQRSQAEEFAESEVTRTTSHGNVGIQGEEHNPVASTSHADILPRDSQGPIPAKGEPDNYSASEQSSSGDESSGVASSGGTEAASAFPSVPRRPAFVRALSRLSTTSRRPRMKAAVGETEEVAGRAQSGPVDPVEGTSSGPMSEPTHPERHSYTPLDHPHDLSARVNDAMVEMVTQRITEVQRLRTEMQQLGMRARESTRLMRQRLQEHADFIHGLREKVEEEETENEEMKEPKKIKKEKTKKEYIPVASTSSDDLVPGDSQEKSLIERHRRAKGDSDKHSTPEQISSGDESSGVAPSGATGAASAYPSMLHGNASVQGSVPLSMEGRRPRMKAVAGTETHAVERGLKCPFDFYGIHPKSRTQAEHYSDSRDRGWNIRGRHSWTIPGWIECMSLVEIHRCESMCNQEQTTTSALLHPRGFSEFKLASVARLHLTSLRVEQSWLHSCGAHGIMILVHARSQRRRDTWLRQRTSPPLPLPRDLAIIQGRDSSTTEYHEATRGRIVAAQVDNPREEHYAHGRRLESWAQEPCEWEEDNTACTYERHAGTEPREHTSTASHEKAGKISLTAQLKKYRKQHGVPARRQRSHMQQYAESHDSTSSTSKGSAGNQEEHSPVASTSRASIVPRDIQGPFPMTEDRGMKGT